MRKEEPRLDCLGLIDSHGHYFDSRFEGEADRILREDVFGCGIAGVINVGTNPKNALLCVEQAKRYEKMFAAIGIHPEDCNALEEDAESAIIKIREMMDTPEKRRLNKIVALGEIGLDYYWQPYDKEKQMDFFERQLCLAEELRLPVIIHDRDAHGDCFETVLRHPNVRGVFHSYSGSSEMAKELTRRGWYISFSGVLTFKNAKRAREVAETVPAELMLVETDCPYLAPEPFRGRLNHSGHLRYTARMLSEIRGISYEELVARTAENTRRLFSLPV